VPPSSGDRARSVKMPAMMMSFLYWALRRLLELFVLRGQSDSANEIELLVLRQQLAVLRRQVARPRFRPADRALLAALVRLLPKERWSSLLVRPKKILRWHRRALARHWTDPRRPVGCIYSDIALSRPKRDERAERSHRGTKRESRRLPPGILPLQPDDLDGADGDRRELAEIPRIARQHDVSSPGRPRNYCRVDDVGCPGPSQELARHLGEALL